MKCMSCSAEIPPQWVSAIQKNECPGCGGEIMNEAMKDLLKDLTDAMKRMPNDPEGLAGWLLSNYDILKIGDGEPTEFHRQKRSNRDEDDDFDRQNLKIAPDPSEFLARTGMANQVQKTKAVLKKQAKKDKRMMALAASINGVDDPYGEGFNIEDEEIEDPELDNDDIEDYKALRAQGMDPFRESANGLSADDFASATMYEEDNSQISEIEKKLMSSNEGRRVLTNERIKKLRAQEALSGGGDGIFRRSG